MKTFGLLALGGAMGLQFEDLSYDNLRGAFSKVNQFENFHNFKNFTTFLGCSKSLWQPKPRHCHYWQ